MLYSEMGLWGSFGLPHGQVHTSAHGHVEEYLPGN
jgi:hypothetical protein